MEKEQYFKCPICGRKILKSNGQPLMWSMICRECYKMMMNAGKITRN